MAPQGAWFTRVHSEFTMSHRYYVEEPIIGAEATLAGPEAHHLAHVMRAKVGEVVTLFDGSGREHSARVARMERAAIRLEILSTADVDRELCLPTGRGRIAPQGRSPALARREAGRAGGEPVHTADHGPRRGAADRWRTGAAGSRGDRSRQAMRAQLADGDRAPQSWNDFVAAPQADRALAGALRLVAHPGVATRLTELTPPRGSGFMVAVGPEGGLTGEEVAAAQAAGWTAVDLGARILRVETAATLLAGWCARSSPKAREGRPVSSADRTSRRCGLLCGGLAGRLGVVARFGVGFGDWLGVGRFALFHDPAEEVAAVVAAVPGAGVLAAEDQHARRERS